MLKFTGARSRVYSLGARQLLWPLGRGIFYRKLHIIKAGVSSVTPALNGRLRDDARLETSADDKRKNTAPLIDHNPAPLASFSPSKLVRSLDKFRSSLTSLAERDDRCHNKDLIAWIDTLLNTLQHPNRPLKVLVIPWGCTKQQITDVVNSLLTEPTTITHHWVRPYLSNRSLRAEGNRLLVTFAESANVVPSYLPSSVVQINLPSPILAPRGMSRGIQILELNSFEDHNLPGCDSSHLRIFVTNSPASLVSPLPESHVPSQLVLLAKGLDTFPQDVHSGFQSTPIIVSSSLPLPESDEKFFKPLSNIESLKTAIQLQTQSLVPWLQEIEHAVKSEIALESLSSILKVEDKRIRSLIQQWAIDSNHELHQSLIPGLNKLTRSKISWWKLYIYFGDMSHVANQTQETLNEYFFPRARPRIGYIAGNIDELNIVGSPSKTTDSVAKDYFGLTRQHILQKHIPQLQQEARDQLLITVVGTQLPLISVAELGVFFYDYSLYTMGSVAALGLILGFKHLQNKWIKYTEEFNRQVVDQAQVAIESYEADLTDKWNSKHTSLVQQIQILDKIVQDYQQCISEYESDQSPKK
ncbi:hypothetical protein NADFUDRAFT_49343 [Nadsonia fulvescens var. elongata DSM 6958]|uniref:Mmc1 C-terminal domain-containing protein n=1 Tax=Nadsonia fulvescens var. elongata DSM 6958 TaxID=857566 RepID=A0A1E3PNM3_9ASCO|nr:hypothetical protein NADFUDRAFT_49343 [Nadsonia fulvescens var. elongata DSM 6958]